MFCANIERKSRFFYTSHGICKGNGIIFICAVRLLAMFCIALVWAYLVGEHKDVSVKPIETLKHGRKAYVLKTIPKGVSSEERLS